MHCSSSRKVASLIDCIIHSHCTARMKNKEHTEIVLAGAMWARMKNIRILLKRLATVLEELR